MLLLLGELTVIGTMVGSFELDGSDSLEEGISLDSSLVGKLLSSFIVGCAEGKGKSIKKQTIKAATRVVANIAVLM